MCGTFDQENTMYSAVAAAQPAGSEMIQALKAMFKELLKRYRKKNSGNLPDIVIIWRDSLGDSMIEAFKEIELAAFLEARKELSHILHHSVQ